MTIAAGNTDCSSGLALRIFAALKYDNPWATGVTYAVGVNGCPTVPNGFGYRVTAITTGVSGGTEPTWPLVIGNTVVDGGATWQCIEVANPSGKGTNAPGYVYSAADLNALRLLAYNTAKAVESSLNTDKVDGGSQLSGTVSPSGAAGGALAGTYPNPTLSGGCAAVYNTAAGQAIPAAAGTVVNFGTKELDTDNAVTLGTAWKFTIPAGKGGVYHVGAVVGVGNVVGSASDMFVSLLRNGTEIQRGNRLNAPVGSYTYCVISADAQCVPGDTLQVSFYSSSAQNLESTAVANRVSIHRVLGI